MTAGDSGEFGRSSLYITPMLTLCVIAVLLNVLVIIVVIKFGRYRASIDIFLTNIAASDILHAGVVLPMHFKNTTNYHKDFYGNNSVCKLTMVIPLVSIMAVILTIVAMAVDRYRVIVTHKNLYRQGALVTIGCIWLISFLVSAPQIYEYNVYTATEIENGQNITYTACGSEGIAENFEKIYASLVLGLAYFLPLSILVVCYLRVMAYVWKNSRRLRNTALQTAPNVDRSGPRSSPHHRTNASVYKRNCRVLKMLISITASFIVLWTPYFIVFAMTEVTGKDDSANFGEWSHMTGRTMSTLSTITNPLLYLVFNHTFREATRDLLYRVCCRSARVGPMPGQQELRTTTTNGTQITMQALVLP